MHHRRVVVIGAGLVGLTSAACFASLGHRVISVDTDREKLRRLRYDDLRELDDDVAEMVRANVASGRLSFSAVATEAVAAEGGADLVFLCLPTPARAAGGIDTTAIASTLLQIGSVVKSGSVIAIRSTLAVGTYPGLRALLVREDVGLVVNPEFLRAGTAIHDFLNSDRVVIGSDCPSSAELVAAVYRPLGVPVLITDPVSAEMIKNATSAFLAVKISFINEVAELCRLVGADASAVVRGVGNDRRIGTDGMSAGPGWGGSCLPKDTEAFRQAAKKAGAALSILDAAVQVNSVQPRRVLERVRAVLAGEPQQNVAGRRIAVLGLTSKAGTKDLHRSPALAVATMLAEDGAIVSAYDPRVDEQVAIGAQGIDIVNDPYVAAEDADSIVVLTEWLEFRGLDWRRLRDVVRNPVIVDARGILDPHVVLLAGFRWVGP